MQPWLRGGFQLLRLDKGEPSTFFHTLVVKSKVNVLSVMENWPVVPVAPPNKHTLSLA